MTVSLLAILVVIAIFTAAGLAHLANNKRKVERRRRRLFAPVERRKRIRRRKGLVSELTWGLRYHLSRNRKPPVKPVSERR